MERTLATLERRRPLTWVIERLTPHSRQREFIESPAKRKIIRAGRRGGKTTGAAILAVEALRAGRRVLYATPTTEQLDAFWVAVKLSLAPMLDTGALEKNETLHLLGGPRSRARIRAKTAWNADTLRGDYADLLILDEWQLMDEDAWDRVGAPMLLDNDGDAVFIYTPPSLASRSASKALNPLHAMLMFRRAAADTSGRWAAFHFASRANPHISAQALSGIARDMTALAIRQEIEAEDVEDAPGALWSHALIDGGRVERAPDLARAVTAIDPSTTSGGDEAGILTAGVGWCRCSGAPALHGFVVADDSLQASPREWAEAAVSAYRRHGCDRLVAEKNNGGEMIEVVIATIAHAPPVTLVHAARGKQTRAEPVSALYEHGRVHHVGAGLGALEAEMCQWTPGAASPNRMDALVWALTDLMLEAASPDWSDVADLGRVEEFKSPWQ